MASRRLCHYRRRRRRRPAPRPAPRSVPRPVLPSPAPPSPSPPLPPFSSSSSSSAAADVVEDDDDDASVGPGFNDGVWFRVSSAVEGKVPHLQPTKTLPPDSATLNDNMSKNNNKVG